MIRLSEIVDDPPLPDYIVVEFSGTVSKFVDFAVVNEGNWVHSNRKDYMLRVDPANPAIPVQRHVHIARKKHVSAKNMHASWNQDGTRHDKGSFNKSIGDRAIVQSIARQALQLPDDVRLERVEQDPLITLLEHSAVFQESNFSPFYLRAKQQEIL